MVQPSLIVIIQQQLSKVLGGIMLHDGINCVIIDISSTRLSIHFTNVCCLKYCCLDPLSINNLTTIINHCSLSVSVVRCLRIPPVRVRSKVDHWVVVPIRLLFQGEQSCRKLGKGSIQLEVNPHPSLLIKYCVIISGQVSGLKLGGLIQEE